jgi:hypothetical protein
VREYLGEVRLTQALTGSGGRGRRVSLDGKVSSDMFARRHSDQENLFARSQADQERSIGPGGESRPRGWVDDGASFGMFARLVHVDGLSGLALALGV